MRELSKHLSNKFYIAVSYVLNYVCISKITNHEHAFLKLMYRVSGRQAKYITNEQCAYLKLRLTKSCSGKRAIER